MALILSGLITVASAGCVLESNRCGPNEMIFGDVERCVCVSNAVATPMGCVLCGENEVPGGTACVCAAGFIKGSSGACEPESALGKACSEAMPCTDATYNYCASSPNEPSYCTKTGCATNDDCTGGYTCDTSGATAYCKRPANPLGMACSEAMPCADTTYNHCATSANGLGYCTKTGCTGNADCTGGYACDTSGATAYCKRPPVGAGMSCTSNADCVGTEATYCDTFVQHACLVEGCAVSPNNCFSGTECCDLAAIGIPMPICIPAGACQS